MKKIKNFASAEGACLYNDSVRKAKTEIPVYEIQILAGGPATHVCVFSCYGGHNSKHPPAVGREQHRVLLSGNSDHRSDDNRPLIR